MILEIFIYHHFIETKNTEEIDIINVNNTCMLFINLQIFRNVTLRGVQRQIGIVFLFGTSYSTKKIKILSSISVAVKEEYQ